MKGMLQCSNQHRFYTLSSVSVNQRITIDILVWWHGVAYSRIMGVVVIPSIWLEGGMGTNLLRPVLCPGLKQTPMLAVDSVMGERKQSFFCLCMWQRLIIVLNHLLTLCLTLTQPVADTVTELTYSMAPGSCSTDKNKISAWTQSKGATTNLSCLS